MGAAGSALAENEKYLDSIEGKLKKFDASWQTLSATLISSDVIKIVVDIGTMFVDTLSWVIDELGTFGLALTTIPLGVFASKIKIVSETFDVLKSAFKATAGRVALMTLIICPPYRDGNIERTEYSVRRYEENGLRFYNLCKWCA